MGKKVREGEWGKCVKPFLQIMAYRDQIKNGVWWWGKVPNMCKGRLFSSSSKGMVIVIQGVRTRHGVRHIIGEG